MDHALAIVCKEEWPVKRGAGLTLLDRATTANRGLQSARGPRTWPAGRLGQLKRLPGSCVHREMIPVEQIFYMAGLRSRAYSRIKLQVPIAQLLNLPEIPTPPEQIALVVRQPLESVDTAHRATLPLHA